MVPTERGARDRRFGVSVEGVEASGAASSFDGNHTNDVLSFMFPNQYFTLTPEEFLESESFESLMERTMWGHLAWVFFPPQGFRL